MDDKTEFDYEDDFLTNFDAFDALDDFDFALFGADTEESDARTASSLSSNSTSSGRTDTSGSTYNGAFSKLHADGATKSTKRKASSDSGDNRNTSDDDKRAKNRVAAKKCRTNKKTETSERIKENQTLREMVQALQQENTALILENRALSEERSQTRTSGGPS